MADETMTAAELNGETVDSEVMKTGRRIIPPTGNYLALVSSIKIQKVPEGRKNEGRPYFNIAVDLFEDIDDEESVGRVYIKASWRFAAKQNGQGDLQSKLYSQLASAVGGETPNPSDVHDALKDTGVVLKLYGSETFQDAEYNMTFLDAEAHDEREQHSNAGHRHDFMVLSISKSGLDNIPF